MIFVCLTVASLQYRFASARMTVDVWLESALRDAERRGLPALGPLLQALARATADLRAADWNDDAAGSLAPRRLHAR